MKHKKMMIQTLLAVSSYALLLTVPVAATDVQTGTLTGKIELKKGNKNENSTVYIKGIQGQFAPTQQAARLDQKGKEFIPHLLPVQKGQKIIFGNNDPFSHNVHLYWGRRSMFNQAQGVGQTGEWVPKRTGEYLILCDIHSEMMAAVLVLDHPFFVIVDHQTSGEFKIENIPEGTYSLVVVRDVRGKLKEHEQEVTVRAGETTTVAVQL